MKTREQKISEIRAACIAANPLIKDLAFGCWIETTRMKVEGERYRIVSYKVINKRGIYDQMIVIREDRTTPTNFGNVMNGGKLDSKFEILGRDIKLSDVLLAINAYGSPRSISSVGAFEKWEYSQDEKGGRHDLDEYGPKWNLLKDNLTDQSDETIMFLHGLLK